MRPETPAHEDNSAATAIQARWRGHQARKQRKDKRREQQVVALRPSGRSRTCRSAVATRPEREPLALVSIRREVPVQRTPTTSK